MIRAMQVVVLLIQSATFVAAFSSINHQFKNLRSSTVSRQRIPLLSFSLQKQQIRPYVSITPTHTNAKPFDDDYFAVRGDKSRNILQWIDKHGQSLKPAAAKANAKSSLVHGNWPRLRYRIQSCALYGLFIVYRAYRGFFVILPAVFRETFRKLETVVDGNPFDDVEVVNYNTRSSMGRSQTTWRTRITVSVLAMVITVSYVLGGALRVLGALIRGAQRGNIPQSFADAASVQERNEKMLLKRRATKNFTAGELE